MTRDAPTARIDIDLNALAANFRALQARQPAAEIAPAVKADAYGLGAARIAQHLSQHGARTFFVARRDEGVDLRLALGAGPVIYVLDGLDDAAAFRAADLRPVLNTPEQVGLWRQAADLKAALHIDTGMNRLGVRPDQLGALPDLTGLSLVMSHLACADEAGHPMNAAQLAAFRAAAARLPAAPRSLANSAGAFLGADYGFDMARPGISLYGGGPFGAPHPEIHPVARLTARVLQVRDVRAGETIGYSATFTAPRDLRTATVGIGYADGVLRHFAAKGFVTVAGQRRPLTGRVSMDAFSVDITGLDVAVGDRVEVFGPAQPIDEVAAASGTVSYEWLTRIGPRVARNYTG